MPRGDVRILMLLVLAVLGLFVVQLRAMCIQPPPPLRRLHHHPRRLCPAHPTRTPAMIRSLAILTLAFVLGALSGAGMLLLHSPATGRHEPVSAPTLQKVRNLAELVTLRATISDVQTTQLQGYTGGIACILIVRGQAELGTDLQQARFTKVDQAQRTAVARVARHHRAFSQSRS